MRLSRGLIVIFVFNLLYIVGFTAYYVSIKNYEFLWYVAVLVFFAILIGVTLEKTKFDYLILWGLSIWGLMHMAGGGVRVGDSVLYAMHILPIVDRGAEFFILKFDQLVHFFGFMVTTLVVFSLLKLKIPKKDRTVMVYFIAVIGSLGLSALNEIAEFTAVLIFPETGVGGYYNTALDLVFNMFGAITGAVIAYFRERNN